MVLHPKNQKLKNSSYKYCGCWLFLKKGHLPVQESSTVPSQVISSLVFGRRHCHINCDSLQLHSRLPTVPCIVPRLLTQVSCFMVALFSCCVLFYLVSLHQGIHANVQIVQHFLCNDCICTVLWDVISASSCSDRRCYKFTDFG